MELGLMEQRLLEFSLLEQCFLEFSLLEQRLLGKLIARRCGFF